MMNQAELTDAIDGLIMGCQLPHATVMRVIEDIKDRYSDEETSPLPPA